MAVPFKFKNATPPVNPTDIDAEKINNNNDSITNGTALSDRILKVRHFDDQSILVTYYIKKFLTTNDLVASPLVYGLVNGDAIAINDNSQNCGKFYVVNANAWVLFKNRILNISIVNLFDDIRYRLVLNDVLDYVWCIDPVIDDTRLSEITTWSSAKIRSLFGSVCQWKDDFLVGDGTAVYTLSFIPLQNNEMVFVGGSWQRRGIDYTIVDNIITFIDSESNPTPIPIGINIWIHYGYLI